MPRRHLHRRRRHPVLHDHLHRRRRVPGGLRLHHRRRHQLLPEGPRHPPRALPRRRRLPALRHLHRRRLPPQRHLRPVPLHRRRSVRAVPGVRARRMRADQEVRPRLRKLVRLHARGGLRLRLPGRALVPPPHGRGVLGAVQPPDRGPVREQHLPLRRRGRRGVRDVLQPRLHRQGPLGRLRARATSAPRTWSAGMRPRRARTRSSPTAPRGSPTASASAGTAAPTPRAGRGSAPRTESAPSRAQSTATAPRRTSACR